MRNLKKELKDLESYFSLIKREPCTPDEEDAIKFRLQCGERIPDGILTDKDGTHYKCMYGDMEDLEVKKWIEYRRLKDLLVIKRCAIICAISSVITWVMISVIFSVML